MTKKTRVAVQNEIAKELDYKRYCDDWGNEHLVDGPHGDCYFDSTTLTIFRMLVNYRWREVNK